MIFPRLVIRLRPQAQLAVVMLVGVICGFLDAAFVVFEAFDARLGVEYVPPTIWLWSAGVWLGLAALLSTLLFLLPARARDALLPFILLALPTFMISVRLVRPGIPRFGLPTGLVAVSVVALWFIASRLVDIRSEGSPKPVWKAMATGALVLLSLGSAGFLSETPQKAPATDAPPAHGPNIVVVFLDTLRSDTATLMPNLQRFASRGTSFDQAYATAPWTLPSHLSAMSGKSGLDVGITFAQQRYTASDTLPITLKHRGYDTAAILANSMLTKLSGFSRGFDTYEIKGRSLDVCRTSPGLLLHHLSPAFNHEFCTSIGTSITKSAASLMSESRRPFFLVLNYTDVHDPYYVPSGCQSTAESRLSDSAKIASALYHRTTIDHADRKRIRGVYEDAARCLDRSLGQLFNSIEALPGPTVTIVTSDHGEQFGMHDLYLHANSLYPQLLHVPLAVVGSGVPAGRVKEPVSLEEIHDLVLHVAGGRMPSRLADLMSGRPSRPVSPVAFLLDRRGSDNQPMATVVDGGYQLIANPSGVDELYDITVDPKCTHNLAADPRYATTRQRLSRILSTHLVAAQDDATNERLQKMRSLGYIR